MKTMKLFRNLFIIFVLLFIFVSVMSEAFIKSTYTLIGENIVVSESPKIEILEARSTNVNGFVKAKITNNTDKDINNQYIKLDFFSKYDNNLGTKYLKVDNLKVGESKNFELEHKYEGAQRVTAEITDKIPETYTFNYKLSDTDKLALFIGGLIVTYYMPARYLFGLFPF